jgi:hypothetical protein
MEDSMTLYRPAAGPTTGTPIPVVNGKGLKHRKLTRQERADLAADRVSGALRLLRFIAQAARDFDCRR